MQDASGNTVFVLNDDDNHVLNGNLVINKGGLLQDPAMDIDGKIELTASAGDEMLINNDDTLEHRAGIQDFGSGGDHFIMASRETSTESAGNYGDGNAVTLRSAGDSNGGQPSAYLYILDEDNFDGDSDPYNDGALKAYLNTSGVWIVNVRRIDDALERVAQLKVYSYTYQQSVDDRSKNHGREVIGMMAQDLVTVIPQAVDQNVQGEFFVNYAQVTPVLVDAINEQQEIIDQQNAMISTQEARIAKLEAAVEKLLKE